MSQPSDSFDAFSLKSEIFQAVNELGFKEPTPVQAATIPQLLQGRDVIGLAQTGTGKTAAFSLPILNNIDWNSRETQVLIQAPTRELAQQVAEAMASFAKHIAKVRVVAIYGGDSYTRQIKDLKRGAQIVVGTPGRTIDHLERGHLKLDNVTHFVLDEADEMLRMGFIEDIETILSKVPAEAQKALFSATMPKPIHTIAKKYLQDPVDIAIKSSGSKHENIEQHYCLVNHQRKQGFLQQFFAGVEFSRTIVFVRTKALTEDVAAALNEAKLSALAIHGDMPQAMRLKAIDRFKAGKATILCATDVAARGLDIEDVDWVINMDVPFDVETYTHRIGRTGRAGRKGSSLTLLTPREKFFLKQINRKFKNALTEYEPPSIETINAKRVDAYCDRVLEILNHDGKKRQQFDEIVRRIQAASQADVAEIAAAIAVMHDQKSPLFLKAEKQQPRENKRAQFGKGERFDGKRQQRTKFAKPNGKFGKRSGKQSDCKMEQYKLDVGKAHGVRAGNIVGAIANEAGLDSSYIDGLKIHDQTSTVYLPEGMPKNIMQTLKKAWVCGRQLNIAKS